MGFGAALLFTVFLTPLQFWQLSRMQDRLDDHDGSIPLSWVFDWDLEDDADDDSRRGLESDSSTGVRICKSCGHVSSDPEERFCSRCGGALDSTGATELPASLRPEVTG